MPLIDKGARSRILSAWLRRTAYPACVIVVSVRLVCALSCCLYNLYLTPIYSKCLQRKKELGARCLYKHSIDTGSCTRRPFTERQWRDPRFTAPAPATMGSADIAACRSQRFLLWTRNEVDYYAGHKHKM